MNDEARIPERKIVRDTDGPEDGQFAKNENAGKPGFNVETVTDRSPWMKEWIRLGEEIEEKEGRDENCYVKANVADTFTIAAVIHAQMLKRI